MKKAKKALAARAARGRAIRQAMAELDAECRAADRQLRAATFGSMDAHFRQGYRNGLAFAYRTLGDLKRGRPQVPLLKQPRSLQQTRKGE